MRYWAVRGSLSGGLSWLERALVATSSSPTPLRIRALSGAAWLAFFLGDVERAEMLCKECLHLYRAARETREAQDLAASLLWLGWLPLTHGNDDEVRFSSRRAVRSPGTKETQKTWPTCSTSLAWLAIGQQDYAQARSLLEESQHYYRNRE